MQASNEKTALALKQASSEVSLFVVDVEKEVAAVEERFLSVVPDCSTREGYNFSKSVRGEVLPIKSGIEKARKTLKEPVIEMGKLIDGSLKPLMQRLEDVYKPHEEAYREKDNEKKRLEEERKAKIQSAFDHLNETLMNAVGQSSSVLQTLIEDLSSFDFNPDVFQERLEEGIELHAEIMGKLSDMLTGQIMIEEQQRKEAEQAARLAEIEAREAAIRQKEEAEQRRIRMEQEVKERAEREEAIRKQAAIDAEKRHQEEMAAAEERARQQAERAAQAERDRLEAERLAEEEAARQREANRKHKAAIHNEILTKLLTTGITEQQGKDIIKLAAKGEAGNLGVTY